MVVLRPVGPEEPCDRCGHASKLHAGPERGSRCMWFGGPKLSSFTKHAALTAKGHGCWCDGFFPVPSGVSR